MSDQAEVDRKAVIAPLLERPLAVGETWYAVSMHWWRAFSMSVGLTEPMNASVDPGPIDNGELEDDNSLCISKQNVLEADFKMVPEAAWLKLKEWYNSYGFEYPRKVILRGYMESIEIHPQPCFVRPCDDAGEPEQPGKMLLVSRYATGAELLANLSTALEVPEASTRRLWIKPTDAEDFVLVNPSQGLDELAANDAVSAFLLETQTAAGKWKRGVASASAGALVPGVVPGPVEDVVAWRAGLKAGDYLDAQDHQLHWFDSRVVEVQPAFSTADTLPVEFRRKAEEALRIHFMGWDSKYDMWFLRSSPKLQPLFTKVRNWRDFRVNDKIEMRVSGRWYVVRVEEVDRVGNRILVRPMDKTQKTALGDRWFDFMSDDIAAAKTHVKSYDFDDIYASSSSSYYSRGNTRGTPSAPGVCGLNNLGNTCFMASMLQCLSNSEPLTRYFLRDRHLDELNKDNPLGCGGHLAEAYGQLLKDMWSGSFTVVSPTDFKYQIGLKAPQFAGYQQQDSQELMNFLMDGLNEDLNRVLKKPVVEGVESDGRPDEVIASLSWEGYKKRNDSVVADVFAGQLRSHVRCNVCDRESTTFDPFMSLSVPIPTKDTKPFVFQAVSLDGGVPMRYKAEVNAMGCIGDVMNWYSRASGIPVKEMLVANVFSHTIHKFMEPSVALSDVYRTDSIIIFRVPEVEGSEAAKEARKKAAAEELQRKQALYGKHYYNSYGTPVENEEDVAICLTGRSTLRKYAYSFTTTRSNDYCLEPFVVPLSMLTGSCGMKPTGKQLHDFVWLFQHRLILEKDRESFSVTNRPYDIYVVKRSSAATYHYHTFPVLAYDDEVVELADRMLYVQWADSAADKFDVDAAEAVALHESLSAIAKKEDALTLYKSFERFNDEEQLGELDMWYCSKCKEHRQAYKRMGLWKLPEVLIVHLKRFQYQQGAYFTHREKIEAHVDFPVAGLDLSRFTLRPQEVPPVYDLFAVSNHMGGLGGGHYTAYAKNFIDNKWYDFNDSSVTPVADPSRVVSSVAYVLFYRRRPTGATGPAAPMAAAAAGGDVDDADNDDDADDGAPSLTK